MTIKMAALVAGAAIGMTALGALFVGDTPAVGKTLYCNELPPALCMACAKARGCNPEQAKSYCGVR